MFNINLDFKREELQKPECSYSLGPFHILSYHKY